MKKPFISKSSDEEIVCSKCHKKFNIKTWYTINGTRNPELRQKILSKEIYDYKCPHCGEVNYYPLGFCYYDEDKDFIVYFSDIENIYYNCSRELYLKYDDKKTFITGANFPNLLIEKITALENGLNHKLFTIYRVLDTLYCADVFQNKEDIEFVDSYLGYDTNNKLSLVLVLKFCGQEENMYKKFDQQLYKSIEAEFKDKLDGSCDFLFNSDCVPGIIKEGKREKLEKISCALVKDRVHGTYFAKIPEFSKEDYEEGDLVYINDNKEGLYEAIIDCKTNEMNLFSCPYVFKDEYTIIRKLSKRKMVTVADSNEPINNTIFETALTFYDIGKGIFPYELAMNSKCVLLTRSEKEKSEYSMDSLIENNNDVKKGIEIKTDFFAKNKDKKAYLNVFLKQPQNLPEKIEGDSLLKVVFKFDDVVKYAIDAAFDGIVVITLNNEIYLKREFLIDYYLSEGILANNKRTIDFLNNLSEKEKEYLGEENFKYLSMIYVEDKAVQEIAAEQNKDIKEVGDALLDAYKKVKEIVKVNF